MSAEAISQHPLDFDDAQMQAWLDDHMKSFGETLETKEFERFLDLSPSELNGVLAKSYLRLIDNRKYYNEQVLAAYLECILDKKSITQSAIEFEVTELDIEMLATNMPLYLADAVPGILHSGRRMGVVASSKVVSITDIIIDSPLHIIAAEQDEQHHDSTTKVDSIAENVTAIDSEEREILDKLPTDTTTPEKDIAAEEGPIAPDLLSRRAIKYLTSIYGDQTELMLASDGIEVIVEKLLDEYFKYFDEREGKRDKYRIILSQYLKGDDYKDIAELESVSGTASSVQVFVSKVKTTIVGDKVIDKKNKVSDKNEPNQTYEEPEQQTEDANTNEDGGGDAQLNLTDDEKRELLLTARPQIAKRNNQLLLIAYQGAIDKNMADVIDFDDDARQTLIDVLISGAYANNHGLPSKFGESRTSRLHRYFSVESFKGPDAEWFHKNEARLFEDLRHFDKIMSQAHGFTGSVASEYNDQEVTFPQLIRAHFQLGRPDTIFPDPPPEPKKRLVLVEKPVSKLKQEPLTPPNLVERERAPSFDLFAAAMRPPKGWGETRKFYERCKMELSLVIDRSAELGIVNSSTALSIKSYFEIPISQLPEVTSQDPLHYLRDIVNRHPGRLASMRNDSQAAPRVKAMEFIVRLLTINGKTTSEVQDLYKGSLEAPLLMIGGIGESLQAANRMSVITNKPKVH